MQLSFDTHAAVRQPLSWRLDLRNAGFPAALPVPALPTAMRRGQTLAVAHPQAVICTDGTLWITHDGEAGDHIVERGERYASDGPRMLVDAMTDARVDFVAL